MSDEPLAGTGTVLVTGADGFIGRHLVARLEAMGRTVRRASRRTGFDLLGEVPSLEGVDHVFHLAGRVGVPAAWDDPIGFLGANTMGTARILEACRQAGCGVTFASAYIYGTPERIPIQEGDRVEIGNPYGLSKHLAEQTCTFYGRHYGVPVVALRLFNVYGPGQDESFLVPFIVRQIFDKERREIEVMDLAPRRDYIFVRDVVDGILAATRAPAGSVFNLGSGVSHSVEEVIRGALAAAGVDKPYRGRGHRRRNEVDDTVADVSAIREATGWAPATDLATGLGAIVEEFQRHPHAASGGPGRHVG